MSVCAASRLIALEDLDEVLAQVEESGIGRGVGHGHVLSVGRVWHERVAHRGTASRGTSRPVDGGACGRSRPSVRVTGDAVVRGLHRSGHLVVLVGAAGRSARVGVARERQPGLVGRARDVERGCPLEQREVLADAVSTAARMVQRRRRVLHRVADQVGKARIAGGRRDHLLQ